MSWFSKTSYDGLGVSSMDDYRIPRQLLFGELPQGIPRKHFSLRLPWGNVGHSKIPPLPPKAAEGMAHPHRKGNCRLWGRIVVPTWETFVRVGRQQTPSLFIRLLPYEEELWKPRLAVLEGILSPVNHYGLYQGWRRIWGMKYNWKGHKDRNSRQEQNKEEWASSVGSCPKTQTLTSPPHEGEPAGTWEGSCSKGTTIKSIPVLTVNGHAHPKVDSRVTWNSQQMRCAALSSSAKNDGRLGRLNKLCAARTDRLTAFPAVRMSVYLTVPQPAWLEFSRLG